MFCDHLDSSLAHFSASTPTVSLGVLVPVAALARVKGRATFIGTTELQLGVVDLLASAFGAGLVDESVGINLVLLDGLHLGLQLLPQLGGKVGGFGGRRDRFGASI